MRRQVWRMIQFKSNKQEQTGHDRRRETTVDPLSVEYGLDTDAR